MSTLVTIDGDHISVTISTDELTAAVSGPPEVISGGGGTWGSITGTLSSQTDLQAALDAKAAASHTHTEDDIDGLVSDLTTLQSNIDGKAATVHAHIISDTTGLQAALDAKASSSHTHIIGDTTGLQAALDLKAAIADIKNYVINPMWQINNALGGTGLFATLGKSMADITVTGALLDGQCIWTAVYVPIATTITGVQWRQTVAGDYTADQYNGWGLYSYSGGTLTLVKNTLNDGNIWKATVNTSPKKAFDGGTYSAAAGLYFVCALYNMSAQVTAPSIGRYVAIQNNTIPAWDFPNSARYVGTVNGQNSLPTPQAMSGLAATTTQTYAELY